MNVLIIFIQKLLLYSLITKIGKFLFNKVEHFFQIEVDLDGWDIDGKTPLIIAFKNGNKKLVVELLEHERNVNQPNKYGMMLIIIECKNFNRKLLCYFIDHGGEVNVKDEDGNTLLIIECQNIYWTEIIEGLIGHGANVNLKNIYGSTALMKLCEGTEDDTNNFFNKIWTRDYFTRFFWIFLWHF